jgi:hypothetical protein
MKHYQEKLKLWLILHSLDRKKLTGYSYSCLYCWACPKSATDVHRCQSIGKRLMVTMPPEKIQFKQIKTDLSILVRKSTIWTCIEFLRKK